MKKLKKSYNRNYYDFQSYENRQVFKIIMSIYKPLFIRWLKDSKNYRFYHDCYIELHGNHCNFDKLLLSNMSKCSQDLISIELILGFVRETIGRYSDHCIFKRDVDYDKLYCLDRDWCDYAYILLDTAPFDLRSRIKVGSYNLHDKMSFSYNKKINLV